MLYWTDRDAPRRRDLRGSAGEMLSTQAFFIDRGSRVVFGEAMDLRLGS